MNKKILLIEDDFDTRLLFSECLQAEDFDVVAKVHGKEAIEHIVEHGQPDLIIMDLNFPFLTPEEFVKALRETEDGENTPVIIISGKGDIDEYAKRLDAQAYLKKPFDIDPLIKLIHTHAHVQV